MGGRGAAPRRRVAAPPPAESVQVCVSCACMKEPSQPPGRPVKPGAPLVYSQSQPTIHTPVAQKVGAAHNHRRARGAPGNQINR